MSSSIREAAVRVLADHPDGLQAPRLVKAIKAGGLRTASAAAVARALAGDRRFTATEELGRTVWRLDATATGPPRDRSAASPPVAPQDPLAGLALRDWQVAAFAAWAGAGCRGVVEAVTGSGKTRLAIAAVRVCLAQGGAALVLVPTLDLQDQWVRALREHVPGVRVGRLGGGRDDALDDHHVVVATPHSAAAVPITPPGLGLLVADEAHRYGAPTWGAALRREYAMRLALTATYERTDDGLVDVLAPYFGSVVHSYTFAAAAADEVIAPFRIALVATALEEAERAGYDAADRRVRDLRKALVDHGLPREPLAMIQAAAGVLAAAEGRAAPPSTPRGELVPTRTLVAATRAWMAAVRHRRDVAAQAAGKLEVVRVVAPALRAAGRRALVFTDTVTQAEQAARILAAHGVAAEEVHGDLPGERRRIRLAQFRRGALQVVVAPRVLDEGVDVPDADLAVVLAAFRTRRQMVQRLGRVLRRKPDGAEARLLVAYAADTREDPATGAHEDFLAEVLPVAREVVRLDADRAPDAVRAWLR